MTKSELKEGGERKADDGPVPQLAQHEVNGCGAWPRVSCRWGDEREM